MRKKALKFGIWTLVWAVVLTGVLLVALRLAVLPYAEGKLLAALQQAGLPDVQLERTGFDPYVLSYSILPRAGEAALAEVTISPLTSISYGGLVLSHARLRLDENWQLPGMKPQEGEANPVAVLSQPLVLPGLAFAVKDLEVDTPRGSIAGHVERSGADITSELALGAYKAVLAFTPQPEGSYRLQVKMADGPLPLDIAVDGGRENPAITASLSLAAYTLAGAEFKDILFSLANNKYRLAATLAGKPVEVQGALDLVQQTATGELSGDVKFATIDALAVKGSFALSSLFPPVVKNGASLSATALQIGGLPLIGPKLVFGYQAGRVKIASATAALFGGQVSLKPADVALPLSKADFTASFEGLDLGQVLQLAAIDGLGGDGRLSGSAPVTYDRGKIILGQAQLKATGSGQVHYAPAEPPAFMAEGGQGALLGQVFSDFRYSGITLTLGGTLGDNLTLGARLEGSNPSFYNGHSVAFNLNLSGALESLLANGLKSFQFSPEAIKQMTQEQKP